MSREVNLHALWQEPLAPALPAARENCPTAFCLHPRAKAKLLLPRALRGLIGAFHKSVGKKEAQL
jgi:hypothetical protein